MQKYHLIVNYTENIQWLADHVVAVVALQEGPNIENCSGVHITDMFAVNCVGYIGFHYMCWMVTGALAGREMNSSLTSAVLIGLVFVLACQVLNREAVECC